MTALTDNVTRIDLPPAGGAVFVTVLTGIVVFFAGVAVFNLGHTSALSSLEISGSVLWLCLVAFWLAMAVFEARGWRRLLVNGLACFSRRAFVDVGSTPGDPPVFRFGYVCLGRELTHSLIALPRIGMVNWGAGQASAMSGEDQNDWTVSVWYRKIGDTGRWRRQSLEDKEIVLVTGYLPREQATAIGLAIVAQLKVAGVILAANEDASEFTVVPDDDRPRHLCSACITDQTS